MSRPVSMNLKGPPNRLLNNVGHRGRVFIRELRKTVLPLPDLLRKLHINERELCLWMRGKGFHLALGLAMAESDCVRDLEIALGSRVAARQISQLLRHRNPRIVREACEAVLRMELQRQEINTAKKRRRGIKRKIDSKSSASSASGGAGLSATSERRYTGPIVGPGSPAHPDLS